MHKSQPGAAAQPWIERGARLGYAVKGVIYLVVGLLALQGALGNGAGKATDARGALHTVAGDTGVFSPFVLGAITVGLLGYALWCLVQAAFDPERVAGPRDGAKGLALRAGRVAAALFYLGLSLTAFRLTIGPGHAADRHAAEPPLIATWSAHLMAAPAGHFLIGVAGAVLMVVGLYQIRQAYRGAFMEQLDLNGLPPATRRAVTTLGRLGVTARGAVFAMIGWLLVRAALTAAHPASSRVMANALRAFASGSGGKGLLIAVAAGLVAYGVFTVIEARYHRAPSGATSS